MELIRYSIPQLYENFKVQLLKKQEWIGGACQARSSDPPLLFHPEQQNIAK